MSASGEHSSYKESSLRLEFVEDYELGGVLFNQKKEKIPFNDEISFLSKEAVYCEYDQFEVLANWKLQVEGLLETYHFNHAHAPFLEGFAGSQKSVVEKRGKDQKIIIPMNDFSDYREEDSLMGINIMYFIFPSTFVLFMQDNYVWFSIESTGLETSRMKAYSFSLSEQNVEKAKKSFSFLKTILPQDFAIQEHQQKMSETLKNQKYTPSEAAIKYFYESLTE